MIYVELQFDPDEAYLQHERELDNPLVIQALTRYKQNLAGDFAEAFQNRGERLFICSQFVYELIQLGRNLEYRQVSFANLARSMTHTELVNALQCVQRSCVSLVDTALMAMEDIRRALPLQGATLLFLELPRAQLDQDAAQAAAQAREVYYPIAWKACGSGITADVAFKYGLQFDAPTTEIQVKTETPTATPESTDVEVRWPFMTYGVGYEDISYATPPQTIMEDQFSRSKMHQFLKQVRQKISTILNKNVKLRLEAEYEMRQVDEDKTFAEVVQEIAAQNTEAELIVPINNTLYEQVLGRPKTVPKIYWKMDAGRDEETLQIFQLQEAEGTIELAILQDDEQFFKALQFQPLTEQAVEEKEVAATLYENEPLNELLAQNPLWHVVRYGKESYVLNHYWYIQQYTLQAYASVLHFKESGAELGYDWKRSGVITDAVIVPADYADGLVQRIGRAFQPTILIKTPTTSPE